MQTEHAVESIDEAFIGRNPTSASLFGRQAELTPGGVTHQARGLSPFPLFIDRNRGSRKWDVDGHEYIDYWLGHGAMLLGHAHESVADAVAAQAADGFHAGGESEKAVEWAQLVCDLVPSAERVRFTASGGEAVQMAIRVARAFTGRSVIVKFQGAFHGWHDAATVGVLPPFDVPYSIGVPPSVSEAVIAVPFNDLDAVAQALDEHPDVAGVLLEPGGCFDDTVPSTLEFLHGLRVLTQERGVLLIFDEVVTGFRYALGGAQEYFGVVPDLSALGKIIGGGLPAGAVCGRAEVMEVLGWRADPEWIRFKMVPHPGTWNANPVVAAAGVATLQKIADGKVIRRAKDTTDALVEGMNAVFAEMAVEAFAYNRSSIFKTCKGKPPPLLSGELSNLGEDTTQLLAGWGADAAKLRKAMLLEGVDLMRKDGFVSGAHTSSDIEETCAALERALARMRREGSV